MSIDLGDPCSTQITSHMCHLTNRLVGYCEVFTKGFHIFDPVDRRIDMLHWSRGLFIGRKYV